MPRYDVLLFRSAAAMGIRQGVVLARCRAVRVFTRGRERRVCSRRGARGLSMFLCALALQFLSASG